MKRNSNIQKLTLGKLPFPFSGLLKLVMTEYHYQKLVGYRLKQDGFVVSVIFLLAKVHCINYFKIQSGWQL